MEWGYLLLEVLPVIFWMGGHMCEKYHESYPNTDIGYFSKRIRSSAASWSLGNRIMGRSLKVTSGMLIMINLFFFFGKVENIYFVLLLNILLLVTSVLSGELKIRKQIDEMGHVKFVEPRKLNKIFSTKK
ncbi:MAG: hypothetical protein ACRCST_08095 [Turicibacter sp.]